jgi:hypothetical protein
MQKINWATVAWSGLSDALVQALKEWRPPSSEKEREYRDALYEYLRKILPEDVPIEKEYRHRGTTCDLYLRWKGFLGETEVFIELKRDLKKKGDFDRLAGQIQGLDPENNIVLVVLVGDSDKSLVGRLDERFDGTKLEIVQVRPSKKKPPH